MIKIRQESCITNKQRNKSLKEMCVIQFDRIDLFDILHLTRITCAKFEKCTDLSCHSKDWNYKAFISYKIPYSTLLANEPCPDTIMFVDYIATI